MCNPVALAVAGLAVSAGGTVLGHVYQTKQANAQADAIEESSRQQMRAMAERQKQMNSAASDQMAERTRQALIERGRLRVASGESGLFDNSGRLMAESFFNEGFDIASIESNRAAAVKQSEYEVGGIRAQAKSAANQISRPSFIGTGLQIAGAGMDAYASTYKPKVKNAP